MIYFLTVIQILFRLIAPFLAPIALLFAVKTDEENKTWAPFRADEFPQPMRRLPKFFKFMETPDDQLIPSGLYEDTVLKIYKKYGWFISQWYWIGFRNVGHGIFYKYGFKCEESDGEKLRKHKDIGPFQVRYGHKVLTDWYGVYGGTHYAMPRFTIRIKKMKNKLGATLTLEDMQKLRELINKPLPQVDMDNWKYTDGNVHVVPTEGREHYENNECWCEPALTYKDEITHKEVWTHKGYEELEQ